MTVKTLADLNNAGKKHWGVKDKESIQVKDEMSTRCANCNHPSGAHTKRGGNDRPCSLCDCKNFVAPNAQDSGIKTLADLNSAGKRFWGGPSSRDAYKREKAKDFSTNPAEIEAAAKKAKATQRKSDIQYHISRIEQSIQAVEAQKRREPKVEIESQITRLKETLEEYKRALSEIE